MGVQARNLTRFQLSSVEKYSFRALVAARWEKLGVTRIDCRSIELSCIRSLRSAGLGSDEGSFAVVAKVNENEKQALKGLHTPRVTVQLQSRLFHPRSRRAVVITVWLLYRRLRPASVSGSHVHCTRQCPVLSCDCPTVDSFHAVQLGTVAHHRKARGCCPTHGMDTGPSMNVRMLFVGSFAPLSACLITGALPALSLCHQRCPSGTIAY